MRLAAAAPPAFARVCLVYLAMEVRSNRCVPRQELAITAGQRLLRASELLSEASPRRGPVSPFGSDMARDPLISAVRPGLGGDPGHVRKTGLPAVFVRNLVAVRFSPSRGSGALARLSIACDSVMCGDPTDSDAVILVEDLVADFH